MFTWHLRLKIQNRQARKIKTKRKKNGDGEKNGKMETILKNGKILNLLNEDTNNCISETSLIIVDMCLKGTCSAKLRG